MTAATEEKQEATTDAEEAKEEKVPSFNSLFGKAAQTTIAAVEQGVKVTRRGGSYDGLIEDGWVELRGGADEGSKLASDYKLTSKAKSVLKERRDAGHELAPAPEADAAE